MALLTLKTFITLTIGILIGFGGLTACSEHWLANDERLDVEHPVTLPLRLGDGPTTAAAFDHLACQRVIAIGETHDRYDHHLNQLAVIRELKNRGREFAVGMEFFQRPFQPHLDAYIRGEITEKAMLKRTEYFQRWRYDYRLYRPIVEYARENGIPLVALNAPSELVRAVSKQGYESAGQRWGDSLPEIVLPPDESYVNRLQTAFAMHGPKEKRSFKRFIGVQLL